MSSLRKKSLDSNAFTIFDQRQISELKEAFQMFDQDGDGIISSEDLRQMFTSIGENPKDEYIEKMINSSNGPLNFTGFLTMMSEKLRYSDSEKDLKAAFKTFDDNGDGYIDPNDFKEALMTMGDRLPGKHIDVLLKQVPVEPNGKVQYQKFINIIKNSE
ncbi:hypothetical protein BB560_000955 [Smittium megazygosporum]|uniref:EF-hand domain-containing protein n=1 Tax=Smittium megazygosporum TaxID=133381 RepID=A0A2T9ZIX5_9FUNG|nr:hypothetical protein BB560_000955 [Smittium megazygosporum]